MAFHGLLKFKDTKDLKSGEKTIKLSKLMTDPKYKIHTLVAFETKLNVL